MADTTIQWADKVWNPIAGCSLVSPGCTNCYAMRVAARIERMGGPAHYAGLTQPSKAGPIWTGRIGIASDETLTAPLRWRRPARIFVNSMSDLFHEGVADEVIDRIFAVMALAPQHTFLLLTKRPARMRDYVRIRAGDWMVTLPDAAGRLMEDGDGAADSVANAEWPLPNVWLGVSVEDQARADERIPILLDTPAAVRWISAEPLLGPVDLRQVRYPVEDGVGGAVHNALTGYSPDTPWELVRQRMPDRFGRGRVDWVVVGGESGPKARPFNIAWARSTIRQCTDAGVPVFMKQTGSNPVGWLAEQDPERIVPPAIHDRAGGDPTEWPEDLRMRRFPRALGEGAA